jgi:prefoldin subunit 5
METLTIGLKAKLDIVNNDMEEITSQMEDLEWKIQECQSLVNELEEIKELLTKLGKALGVELV